MIELCDNTKKKTILKVIQFRGNGNYMETLIGTSMDKVERVQHKL